MASNPLEVIRFVSRNSKRIAVSVAGGILVLLGLVMIVLPGPGILVIALGFAVLGTEYAWAAAALERTKRSASSAGQTARRGASAAGRAAGGTARSVGRRMGRRR
ncbi:MAG: PGPGW domain-containing protein [Actinomycetota bacterium]